MSFLTKYSYLLRSENLDKSKEKSFFFLKKKKVYFYYFMYVSIFPASMPDARGSEVVSLHGCWELNPDLFQ